MLPYTHNFSQVPMTWPEAIILLATGAICIAILMRLSPDKPDDDRTLDDQM